MSFQKRSEALREALQFLVSSSIPSQHKTLMIDLVGQAMRDEDAAQRSLATQAASPQWLPHELEAMKDLLQGRIARSWQHADELLMRVAMQLKRTPADVRTKATELNFGAGIDFRLARAQAASNSGS